MKRFSKAAVFIQRIFTDVHKGYLELTATFEPMD